LNEVDHLKKFINQNSMKSSPIQYVTVEGTEFAYKTFGDGAPLLLLQRFRGTMNEWDPAFIEVLAGSNKVYVLDNRGIGKTKGVTPKTIVEIATDALRFAQALQLTKVNLLGWSLGGIVAQVFAIHFPEMVNKLILVATGPAASPETIYPSSRFLEIARHEENTLEDHQTLFFTETAEGRQYTRQSLDRMKSFYHETVPATTQANWTNQALAMRDFFSNPLNYFGKLKEIQMPVLIGAARQDIAFPLLDAYLLAREIPQSYLVTYPDAGHGFHHQYYASFGALVNAFISEKYFA
jgi:pimeloyl-ACP methyl ester carboxylesterase